METKRIIAVISTAAVMAMVTPAYAGLFGGRAGAMGGSMTGGFGGLTGQSAFDGRGAASMSSEAFHERPAPRAKPAAGGAEPAQRSGTGTATALGGSAAHEADGSAGTSLGQASGQSYSTTSAAGQLPPRAASTAVSTAGSAAGSAATPATTTAPPAATAPPALTAPPAAMTNGTGAGSIDAQHSRGEDSVAVSGEASGSASRTQ